MISNVDFDEFDNDQVSMLSLDENYNDGNNIKYRLEVDKI